MKIVTMVQKIGDYEVLLYEKACDTDLPDEIGNNQFIELPKSRNHN